MKTTDKPACKLIRFWVVITAAMKKRGYDYIEPDLEKPDNLDPEHDDCRCYQASLPANYCEILASNGQWRLWDSDHTTIPSKYGRYLPTCYNGSAYVMTRIDREEHNLLLITITDADNQTVYKVKRFELERVERLD